MSNSIIDQQLQDIEQCAAEQLGKELPKVLTATDTIGHLATLYELIEGLTQTLCMMRAEQAQGWAPVMEDTNDR